MYYDDNNQVINFTEKRLFELFSLIEARGKKTSDAEYHAVVNNQLPSKCMIPLNSSDSLRGAIRNYRRRKSKRESLSTIVNSASNNIALSIDIPDDIPPAIPPKVQDASPSSVNTQHSGGSSSSQPDFEIENIAVTQPLPQQQQQQQQQQQKQPQ